MKDPQRAVDVPGGVKQLEGQSHPLRLSRILIVLVLLFYWAFSTTINAGFPYQAYDPEYAYFMGSLQPFGGSAYTYMDHPGTPLEVVGTAILGATYPFFGGGQTAFIRYHLEHPALFLTLAHVLLLLSSIRCALFFFNRTVPGPPWESTPAAASLAMMFYVIHPAAFTTLTYWSHNSLGFPVGTFLLLLLFRAVERRGLLSWKTIFGLGLGAGILTATVVYFAGWIIGGAVTVAAYSALQAVPWRRTLASLIVYVSSAFAGFVLGVLPAFSGIPGFLHWLAALALHQGKYGQGPSGITTPLALLDNFWTLLQAVPFVFLSAGIGVGSLAYLYLRRRSGLHSDPGLWAFALGLVLQILVTLLVILKHPAANYLLAVAAMVPMLFLTVLSLWGPVSRSGRLLGRLLSFVVLPGLAISLATSMHVQSVRISNISSSLTDISRVVNERALDTGRTPGDVVVVWGYGVYTPCNALVRINSNYIHNFGAEIQEMCANQYIVNDVDISQAVAASAGGMAVDLNTLAWDLIFVRSVGAGKLVPLLQSKLATQGLADLKTGLPGYSVTEPLTVLERQP